MVKPMPLPAAVKLVGVSNYQDVVRRLSEGEPVEVAHEPENPFDPHACVARTAAGVTIGYLPRALAPRLLAGEASRYAGRVDELLRGETWGVRVLVTGPAAGPAADQSPDADPGDSQPAALTPAPVQTGVPAVLAEAPSDAARDGVEGLEQVQVGMTAPAVFAKSGRELGVFVRHDGNKVVVRQPSGLEAAFPDELVCITAA